VAFPLSKRILDLNEHIYLVCPAIIKTGLSVEKFYDQAASKGLLTPMNRVLDALDSFLGSSTVSGQSLCSVTLSASDRA
jgi:hypothetical protein